MRDNASTSVLAFRDIRWNSWRWRPILERWGHLKVFIDPDIIKTTTFLISDGELASSLFFVQVPLDSENWVSGIAYYAVTTNHSVRGNIAIRFTLKSGGVKDEPIPDADWERNHQHDIAVLPLTFPLHNYDVRWIAFDQIAKNVDYLHVEPNRVLGPDGHLLEGVTYDTYWQRYGIGDEVFTVGLFGNPSQSLRSPVVRFGHIALKPAQGEKILAELPSEADLVPMDAFLVEMAAWEGQSGSPVFLRPYPFIGERDHKGSHSELNYMIGMIQGFYPGELDIDLKNETTTLRLNMGISIVIPSYVITEVLMRPKLRDAREKTLRDKQENPKTRANPRVRPSAASLNKETPLTKASFEDTLKQVSRKIPEADSEKK